MTIAIIPKKGVFGNANFTTKTITIYPLERALEMNADELKRLTNLGECCIKVAQTLGNKEARELIQELNLTNYGSKEYPTYETDMHWFFGVVGGLEIYVTQLCDGPRYASVCNCDNIVFKYNGLDATFDEVENPQVTEYIKGSWESKVFEWYKTARNILDKKVLTLEESVF